MFDIFLDMPPKGGIFFSKNPFLVVYLKLHSENGSRFEILFKLITIILHDVRLIIKDM